LTYINSSYFISSLKLLTQHSLYNTQIDNPLCITSYQITLEIIIAQPHPLLLTLPWNRIIQLFWRLFFFQKILWKIWKLKSAAGVIVVDRYIAGRHLEPLSHHIEYLHPTYQLHSPLSGTIHTPFSIHIFNCIPLFLHTPNTTDHLAHTTTKERLRLVTYCREQHSSPLWAPSIQTMLADTALSSVATESKVQPRGKYWDTITENNGRWVNNMVHGACRSEIQWGCIWCNEGGGYV
jgi:hypothetical protein